MRANLDIARMAGSNNAPAATTQKAGHCPAFLC